jgi:hypothetical protein
LIKKLEKGSRPFFSGVVKSLLGVSGVKLAGWGVSSRLSFLSQTSKGVRLDGWEEEKRRERRRGEGGRESKRSKRVERLNMSNGMKTRPLHELERARGWGDRFYFLNPLDSVPFFAGWRADEHVATSLLHPPPPPCCLFDRVDEG